MKQSSTSKGYSDKSQLRFPAKAEAAFKSGLVDEAIRIYEQAISEGHKSCSIYKTLGEMHLWLNEYEEALEWLQKACQSEPPSAELLDRIVSAFTGLGRPDEAVEEITKAMKLQPNLEIVPGSLTEALFEVTGSDVIEQSRERADAMGLIAEVLFKAQQYGVAEKWYTRILKYKPDAFIYARLAHICRFTGQLSRSAEYQRMAVEKAPDNAEYLANLSVLLISLGQIQDGVCLARKAVQKQPTNAAVHSNFLWCLCYLPEQDPQMLFEEHKRWGQTHAPMSMAKQSHDNVPDPDRRLRVGYISPDFRMHSAAYNFEAFLSGRDRDAVEVYGYGNVARPDQITRYLKRQFDNYRNIYGLDDEAVARMIEQDQIDILVVIGGHAADNSLCAMAYKPAPIQVDYGAISTTGMQQIDYRLTDSLIDPPRSQKFYVEESVYLSGGLVCYRPLDNAPPVTPLPAEQKGYITFGSFNNNCKVNTYVMELWAQILKASENSRLLLKFKAGDDRKMVNHYMSKFEKLGISKERIQIYGWQSPLEHLQLYSQIDIALDTYPYNGCITTLEAMWMGVPVVSLVGENGYISRLGLSLLSRVELEFFAASTPAEYVAKAAALAQNRQALAKIRSSMRQRMVASGICDAKTFAASLEAAYRKMWHRWCRSRGAEVQSGEIELASS